MKSTFLRILPALLLLTSTGFAADAIHRDQANAAIDRGIAFLRTTQQDDGAWSPQPGPAITALVLTTFLDHPNINANDPDAAKALRYILASANEDGGIYNNILANYNTSISVSALSRCRNEPGVAPVIDRAVEYLRGLQWSNGAVTPDGAAISPDHPFYGGAGYGHHGRPDMSNTQMMIQALRDAGIDSNDVVYQRAMVFISRCQGTASNDMFADKIVRDGGFIYATSLDKDNIGVPESKAGEETITENGQPVSHLRTYGSMTYAGFKSYLYADLTRTDPRVVDAWNWIRNNYTVTHNPGLPQERQLQGHYYYLVAFSRALSAWGSPMVQTPQGPRDWRNDLINQLVSMQREDGSWVNDADRWLEGDANLVTAYSLIALQAALR